MSFRIEPAGLEDVATIVEHRRAIFQELASEEASLAAMCEAFRPWLAERMRTATYLGRFAGVDGQTASGVGLWLIDWPPGVLDPDLPRAYILDVYTRPEHRRQGMARAL